MVRTILHEEPGFAPEVIEHQLAHKVADIPGAAYGPHAPRPRIIDSFVRYITERVRTYPDLSIERMLREVRAMGYKGGRTALGDQVREVRPPGQSNLKYALRRQRVSMPRWTSPTKSFQTGFY
jgi:hypothetical protein